MVSFKKRLNGYRARVNVYLTKMTVTTAINHPKLGKNQLYRKNMSFDMIAKVFENPRVHTRRGYRKK